MCGCSGAKDISDEKLENVKDLILGLDKDTDESQEDSVTENTISIATDKPTAEITPESGSVTESENDRTSSSDRLDTDSDNSSFTEERLPLKYENEYFTVSPSENWECCASNETDCSYALADPKSVQEAGLLVSFQVVENAGTDYGTLSEVTDGIDKMYEEMGFTFMRDSTITFRGRETYCITISSPYGNYLTQMAFQDEKNFYNINIVYPMDPITDQMVELAGEVVDTFELK